MTLILTLRNSDQFIQISDRRLSIQGMPVDDESNKASLLTCRDARLMFGFTGLARTPGFNTRRWLLEILFECGPPDYTIDAILQRFKERLTVNFNALSQLQHLSQRDKRLSILFSGYLDGYDPPIGVCAIFSNYQDFTIGEDSPEAWEDFRAIYQCERRPWQGEMSLIQMIGAWPAVDQEDIDMLRALLEQRKPAEAIVGKGVKMMRAISNRPQAGRTVGQQITTICLPRDPTIDLSTGYHTMRVGTQIFFPSHAYLMDDEDRFLVDMADVQSHSNASPVPMVFPKVGRNAPCPCKSGRKYKHCHGR